MGLVAGIFGSFASIVLIPLGFAIGVYIPLVITDTAFQIYNCIGLSNFARQLFGSTNGIGVNWHNGFSQYLLAFLIIGVVVCVFSVLCHMLANWTKTGQKSQIVLSRFCYGGLSIVIVPIVFIFSVSITSIIFAALSGNSSVAFITSNERQDFVDVLNAFSTKITNILNGSGSKWDGQSYDWQTALTTLEQYINSISLSAKNQGMSDLQNLCETILQDIANCKSSTDANYISTQINNIVSVAQNMSIGQRITDISSLQTAYDNLLNSQMGYATLIKDLNSLKPYQSWTWNDPNIDKAFAMIFTGSYVDGGETKVITQGFLSYVNYKGVDNPNTFDYLFSINNIFSDVTIKATLADTDDIHLLSGMNQLIIGCNSSSEPLTNHYWTCGSWSIISMNEWIGINNFYERVNPLPSFTLSGIINGFVLGQNAPNSSYSIWNIYWSSYGSFFKGHMERVVVGTIAANMTMGAMMGYAWYMVGRMFELVILWFGSVIASLKADAEGTQFKLMMKAIANKTLSIIFIELVFTVMNTMINLKFINTIFEAASQTSASFFDPTAAAIILADVIFFCASYPTATALCSMILGEAGQLRSIGDQYSNLTAYSKGQYGGKSTSVASQGTNSILNTSGQGIKKGLDNKMHGNEFNKMMNSGNFVKGSGDKKLFVKSGGKFGSPTPTPKNGGGK